MDVVQLKIARQIMEGVREILGKESGISVVEADVLTTSAFCFGLVKYSKKPMDAAAFSLSISEGKASFSYLNYAISGSYAGRLSPEGVGRAIAYLLLTAPLPSIEEIDAGDVGEDREKLTYSL